MKPESMETKDPQASGDSRKPSDPLTNHRDDQEHANPSFRWRPSMFWGAIVFSILYGLNLPGTGGGQVRIANGERDVAMARNEMAILQPIFPVVTEDALRAVARDPVRLADGKTTF